MRTLICVYLIFSFQVYMTVYISSFTFSKCWIDLYHTANVVVGFAIWYLMEALYSEPKGNAHNHRCICYCCKLVFTITLCCSSHWLKSSCPLFSKNTTFIYVIVEHGSIIPWKSGFASTEGNGDINGSFFQLCCLSLYVCIHTHTKSGFCSNNV